MGIFKNPGWVNSNLRNCQKLEEVPAPIFEELKSRLKKITSDAPAVTICIATWNEELNIIRCLDSLSYTETKVPFDIIVINNNSTDRTQEVLDRLEVQSYMQPIQGCGPARELGQNKAKGEYILLGDADCLYPKKWVDIMHKNLVSKNTVAVYGRHSFLGRESIGRWQYSLYEQGKRVVQELRHLKHPYLNAYGMSFGYHKKLGLKEGFIQENIRGEDGRMCFDLMKYGKVRFVRDGRGKVWTEERNFSGEGGFGKALYNRLLREVTRFEGYFKRPEKHDTKTSANTEATADDYIKLLKSKYRKKAEK